MSKLFVFLSALMFSGLAMANCGYVNGNYICQYGNPNGNSYGNINGQQFQNQQYGSLGYGSIGNRGYSSQQIGNSTWYNMDNGQSVVCRRNFSGKVYCQ